MTCQELNKFVDQMGRRQSAALPEPLRRHLEHCVGCRSLLEFLGPAESGAEVSPQARARIQNSILSSLKPVSPLPSNVMLALGFLLIFGLLSVVFVGLFGRGGVAGMGQVQFAGMFGAIVLAASLLALSLSREMVPGEKKLLAVSRLVLFLLLPLFLVVAVLFPWQVGQQFLPASWKCFRAGFLSSLPAAGLLGVVLSRGAVLSLAVVGASAGLLAGLVGVLGLHFGCGMHTAPHIALSHIGVPLASGMIGYVMGHYLAVLWPGGRFGGRER